MPESLSGYASIGDSPLGVINYLAPYNPSWAALFPSDGTQAQLGNVYGALNQGGTGGIVYTIAGIDPVIQFILLTRLRTTGQIWPCGNS